MAFAYSYLRFSTPEQSKGDSERRQEAKAVQWAKANGHTLADDTIADKGVSGYRGKNRRKGALAAFLSRCEAGTIKPGSILLIEELDRLSRQEPLNAFELLKEILDHDISVMVLNKNMLIDSKTINKQDVFLTVSLSISLAHEESKKKGERIRETYEQRRKEAVEKGRAIPGKQPFWIDRVDGKFKLNENAETVKYIFELKGKGFGNAAIIQKLDEKGIAAPEGAKRWHTSRIKRIIQSRTVIGELAFYEHQWTKGKLTKVPTGQIASGYYPAVIDQELFDAINYGRIIRKKKGRIAKVDMLTGLCYCGYCGGTIIKQNHIKKKDKTHEYLQCGDPNCGHRLMWPKMSLMAAIMGFLKDAENYNKKAKPDDTVGKISALQSKLDEMSKLMEEAPSKALANSMNKIEGQIAELMAKRTESKTIQSISAGGWQEFRQAVADGKGEEVNAFLRQYVSRIDVWTGEKAERSFKIHFHNGAVAEHVERLVSKADRMRFWNAINHGQKVDEPTNEIIRQSWKK